MPAGWPEFLTNTTRDHGAGLCMQWLFRQDAAKSCICPATDSPTLLAGNAARFSAAKGLARAREHL
jgi:hypothetical protein